MLFTVQKTRTMGLLGSDKKFDDVCSCFDTLPACDIQRDRQMNMW